MFQEIAVKWIDALESGKFNQGPGRLTVNRGGGHKMAALPPLAFTTTDFNSPFTAAAALETPSSQADCCLGVLCKLAIADGVPVKVRTVPRMGSLGSEVEYDGEVGSLPDSVRAWAGMKTKQGTLGKGDNCMSLAALNDNGCDFRTMAQVIRASVDTL